MSGLRSVTPIAMLDRELQLQARMTLVAWCASHGATVDLLCDALALDEDRYGLLDQLAATLGVSRESLPRAA